MTARNGTCSIVIRLQAMSPLFVVSLLVSVLCLPALAQRQPRSQHPYDARRSVDRATLPDLGQARPVYQLVDLNHLVESLGIDEANKPVIEMILTTYQDQYREGSDAYQLTISELKPVREGAEELEARKIEARDELKRIREDITRRYRNGEWGDDHAKMREVLSEATRSLQEQVLAIDKAKAAAVDWSGYFTDYGAAFEIWNEHRMAMDLEVETQLKAFLEPDQRSNWQAALNDIWIRRELPQGELGGESVDLEQLLRARVLDEEVRKRAREEIERWKLEVGPMLASRAESFDHIIRAYIASGASQSATAWMDAANQELQLREALRDTNLSAVYLVADALGPEHGLRFQEAVLSQVYPTIFARGRVLRGIDEALAARPPMDEEKSEALQELRKDATAWMLEHAYRSQEEFQQQEASRFLVTRQRTGEKIFIKEEFPGQEWEAVVSDNRETLLAWEATMMENIRSIIGDARYSRLSVARSAPARDDEGARGRSNRGGRDGRGGRGR